MMPRRSGSLARTAHLVLSAALVLGLVTACTSDGEGSAGAAPAVVDRTDPSEVADAFMTAYAGGDLALACSFTSDDLRSELDSKGQCAGQAGWSATVTKQGSCTSLGDEYAALYEASGHVDRFLVLAVFVTQSGDQWAATAMTKDSPGGRTITERLYCKDDAAASTQETT